jgi:hypothetical protein
VIWFAPFYALGDEEPDPRGAHTRGEPSHAPESDDEDDTPEPERLERARKRPDPDEPRASRR